MKAPVNRNARKVRHTSNQNRPNGASVSATSLDTRDLLVAALEGGNRETRRLARRNLRKRLKADGVIR